MLLRLRPDSAVRRRHPQDICVATCYATLGIDSVETGVNQGGCTVVVCNRKSVALIGAMANKMPTLKAIVYLDTFVPVEEAQKKLVVCGLAASLSACLRLSASPSAFLRLSAILTSWQHPTISLSHPGGDLR